MDAKNNGTAHDPLIHPGETIADVLKERELTQSELAARTGVSTAYVCNIIAGKKDISANFAMALEYALGVPKSFWLNLQANYEAERLEANKGYTITDEERAVREALQDIVEYLRQKGMIPVHERKDDSILSLRKVLQISNIANLGQMVPAGACRISAGAEVNPCVLGAWIRLCQLAGSEEAIKAKFDKRLAGRLTNEIKEVMCREAADTQQELKTIMGKYGIDFSVMKSFEDIPAQGYIAQKGDRIYQVVLTEQRDFPAAFWFSLFHEIGHIANGDIGKSSKFVDSGSDPGREKAADSFADNMLLNPESYKQFVKTADFSAEAINTYAHSQNVQPYIVIGRLEREKLITEGENYETTMRKIYEAKLLMEGLEDVKAGRTVDGDSAIGGIRSKYGL